LYEAFSCAPVHEYFTNNGTQCFCRGTVVAGQGFEGKASAKGTAASKNESAF
jgi:hypothetical protein